MTVDGQTGIRFVIIQGTLPWQPEFAEIFMIRLSLSSYSTTDGRIGMQRDELTLWMFGEL